ncbi:hypothetical protein GCM10010151_44350 [Actinoallomurus spadix]|uniref:Uncharacterized protein n=1 Tax=Actinoallomurus spadix TaxID=79912 RepID=A0ABN0WXS1_9ACTN
MAMLADVAVERYRSVRGRCGHTWTADYDVQYVTDDVGATFAFYRLDGVPVPPRRGDLPEPRRHGRRRDPRGAARQPARAPGQRRAARACHHHRRATPGVRSAPAGARRPRATVSGRPGGG